MRQYNHWFENKTIAVVGNAESLFDNNYGEIIDSHDVVCRMNKGICGTSQLSHGSKTDVLVFSQWATIRRAVKAQHNKDIKYYLQTSRKGRQTNYIVKQTFPEVESFMCPIEILDSLESKLGLRKKQSVSTGITFLELLHTCSPSRVSIFGFDWKKTPTFYTPDFDMKPDPHDFEKERTYCLNTFTQENGFTLYK